VLGQCCQRIHSYPPVQTFIAIQLTSADIWTYPGSLPLVREYIHSLCHGHTLHRLLFPHLNASQSNTKTKASERCRNLMESIFINKLMPCNRPALNLKFETYIPRNETVRPRSQFLHSCTCERFIYSHDRCSAD
jgi:hypothetical protein